MQKAGFLTSQLTFMTYIQRFVSLLTLSYLVRTPVERFSHEVAHYLSCRFVLIKSSLNKIQRFLCVMSVTAQSTEN